MVLICKIINRKNHSNSKLICNFYSLFGHSILFSSEPEEAHHFRSILLPLFSPDAFPCENGNRTLNQCHKISWYNAITKDVCDSWFAAEIDPFVKKSGNDIDTSSVGKPIILYEAFKKLASQWVSKYMITNYRRNCFNLMYIKHLTIIF